ncbi:MAG: hypothetical protein ACJ708_10625 [Nitrososphaeraceae archaeon]
MKLKEIGLQLCTCTWIEIMTGAGVTLYLILAMHNYILAALTAGLFAPLIVFHFVITVISKRRDEIIRIEGVKNKSKKENNKMSIRLTQGV